MRLLLGVFIVVLCYSCNPYNQSIDIASVKIDTLQGSSLLGKPLVSPQLTLKDSVKIKNYIHTLETYQSNPRNPDFIIWLGRRMAYLGDYEAALGIFNEGKLKFPEDARFYRHMGHRFISTRQLNQAVNTLEIARTLIQGTEDVVEPDGIPNRLNQPVSSLHTNIYYHLGLAYYLQDNLPKALANFKACLEVSTNDDMVVASKHWLYMIYRRMGRQDVANMLLEDVNTDMSIIENDGYHQLLLFYKDERSESALRGNGSLGSSEAVHYGIANWYHYNGETEKAMELFNEIVNKGNWAAFGFIAAEADLARLQSN